MLALFRGLPAASRLGVTLTLVGLGIDLVVHVAGGATATGRGAMVGHVLTLGGMVLALAGVVWMGLRASSRLPADERRS